MTLFHPRLFENLRDAFPDIAELGGRQLTQIICGSPDELRKWVWSMASGSCSCSCTLEGHTGTVAHVAISADVMTLLSSSKDTTLR